MENFYIAVTQNGQPDAKPGNIMLVAGPFSSLEIAQEYEPDTRWYVLKHFELQGSSFWGYSIVGIQDYDKPGKLNKELGIGVNSPVQLALW